MSAINLNTSMDNSEGYGSERLPLLGATNTRARRPLTTPLSTSPRDAAKSSAAPLNIMSTAIAATTTTTIKKMIPKMDNQIAPGINKPLALDANRNMFQKQSRPRKAVAEFRKKSRQVMPSWSGRVGVHIHVDEINIDSLTEAFAKKAGWNLTNNFEVVRLWQTEPPYIGHEHWSDWPLSEDEDGGSEGAIDLTAAMPEIYVFSFGACVFWNFPNQEYEKDWITNTLLEELDDCCGDLYKEDEIENAMDSVSFRYGVDTFTIKQDVVTLASRDPGEKLAVSFAMAKSSLLSLYELRVQDIIERNSHLPEEMVKNGRIHMSMRDMSREVGRLFLVKHGINLDQNIIDTPEEFWEDDRFESNYDTTVKYLKITKRLDLVNSRLDMIGELHNKILEENHIHHAVILEWIIILLIVVEVLLDMLHLGFY